MKKNMGNVDRIIRILIAAVIAYLSYSGTITGTLNLILVILAVFLLLTSLFGFCPLYALLKISTNKSKSS